MLFSQHWVSDRFALPVERGQLVKKIRRGSSSSTQSLLGVFLSFDRGHSIPPASHLHELLSVYLTAYSTSSTTAPVSIPSAYRLRISSTITSRWAAHHLFAVGLTPARLIQILQPLHKRAVPQIYCPLPPQLRDGRGCVGEHVRRWQQRRRLDTGLRG
jgi:hypothetical protein